MNISILTAAEVLRICDPQTELEKRLFEIASSAQDDIAAANEERAQAINDLGQYECDSCEDKLSDIETAIQMLESGRTDDALKKLKSIG